MGEQPDGSGEPAPRTAAARVLALLDAFAGGGGALTLTEISRYADLTLSTTHRLVQELLAWGGLEVGDDGKYRLSARILGLASASTEAMHLREHALPYLVDLHRSTDLTVHLAVRDGRNLMYLEALRAHPNYTGENRIGGRLRLHLSATGLVLLAHTDEAFQEEYLDGPLERLTPSTPSDAETLRGLLGFVREHRYAVAPKFIAPDVGSVAAPVYGRDGSVRTAVGIVYPIHGYDPRGLIDAARLAARRISDALKTPTALDRRTIEYNRRKAGLS